MNAFIEACAEVVERLLVEMKHKHHSDPTGEATITIEGARKAMRGTLIEIAARIRAVKLPERPFAGLEGLVFQLPNRAACALTQELNTIAMELEHVAWENEAARACQDRIVNIAARVRESEEEITIGFCAGCGSNPEHERTRKAIDACIARHGKKRVSGESKAFTSEDGEPVDIEARNGVDPVLYDGTDADFDRFCERLVPYLSAPIAVKTCREKGSMMSAAQEP